MLHVLQDTQKKKQIGKAKKFAAPTLLTPVHVPTPMVSAGKEPPIVPIAILA